MTKTLDLDAAWTVTELIARYPGSIQVINRYGIDACCGGASTLREAALTEGADLDELLDALRRAIGNR